MKIYNITQHERYFFLDNKKNNNSKIKFSALENDNFSKIEERASKKGNFFASSEGIDMTAVLAKYNRKIKGLPLLMDGVCKIIGLYLSGRAHTDRFVEAHMNAMPNLYKRISTGIGSEEYQESYKPEISMIKKVTGACNSYYERTSNNLPEEDAKKALDLTCEDSVIEYIDTDHKRGRMFTV